MEEPVPRRAPAVAVADLLDRELGSDNRYKMPTASPRHEGPCGQSYGSATLQLRCGRAESRRL